MKLHKHYLIVSTLFCLILTNHGNFTAEPHCDLQVILPQIYAWTDNGEINAAVHAWVFDPEKKSSSRTVLIKLLDHVISDATEEEKEILNNRIRYFLVDNKRGINLKINISGNDYPLAETSSNGHTFSIIKIPGNPHGKINFTVHGSGGVSASGAIKIIGSEGYSIISDFDDTIKISDVSDKKEMVKNVFIRRFRPVKGMSELYRIMKTRGTVFHYISGSPWQLYPSINNFLQDEKFPEGSVELKMFRLKDKSAVNFITADQFSFKVNAIRTVMNRFPSRKFILIGDSGEKDPEVYCEIARQYKNRVKYIFIRDVGLIGDKFPERKAVIKKAGEVPVVIFNDPAKLHSIINKL